VALVAYYVDLLQRISQHETIILGQNRLVPGSMAALRVVVRDGKDASPLPGAEINVLSLTTDYTDYTDYTDKKDKKSV